jgi:D-amino peptidase
VPILLVTGDKAACDEAREFFPASQTVAVKQGIGRQRARCIHPEKSRELIREGAKEAVSLTEVARPFKVETPLTVRLEYYRSDMADAVANRPGTRSVDARTVERVVDNVRELLSI